MRLGMLSLITLSRIPTQFQRPSSMYCMALVRVGTVACRCVW
jgi:hypothetical protein